MNKKIAIIDYGINNISSIFKIFQKIEIEAHIIKEQEKLDNYKYIILKYFILLRLIFQPLQF